MARDLQPEEILSNLKQGCLEPFYLFYGPDEFRMERLLDRVRADFIPEGARDFNLEVLYADKKINPEEIIGRAQSFPFMTSHRLIIVRRTEAMTAGQLTKLIPYLEAPTETTCLIFTAAKTNFTVKFYKFFRQYGRAVIFDELKGRQLDAWIRLTAKELGLEIDKGGSDLLQEIVGTRLRDLYGELEKLHIRHGKAMVGAGEVKELAVQSRSYTIFEIINNVSDRKTSEALVVLHRYLEEEGERNASLGIVGMLNREMRLLWESKRLAKNGVRPGDAARELSVPPFAAKRLFERARKWDEEDLEKAFFLLYETDGRLKSGMRPNTLLEALVVELCG